MEYKNCATIYTITSVMSAQDMFAEMNKLLGTFVKDVYDLNPEDLEKLENLEFELSFKFPKDEEKTETVTRNMFEELTKKLAQKSFSAQNSDLLRISLAGTGKAGTGTGTGAAGTGAAGTGAAGTGAGAAGQRIELEGQTITAFCNSLQQQDHVRLTKKINDLPKKIQTKSPKGGPVDIHPYGVRVKYNLESSSKKKLDDEPDVQSIRLLRRRTFSPIFNVSSTDTSSTEELTKEDGFTVNSNTFFKLDLSVVKELINHKKDASAGFVTKAIQFVFSASTPEKYEVEIELVPETVKDMCEFLKKSQKVAEDKVVKDVVVEDVQKILLKKLKEIIQLILSGLQNSNYPVSYTEIHETKQAYAKVVQTPKPVFIGYDSLTLTKDNEQTILNAGTNYYITDKADGERRLLFIMPSTSKASTSTGKASTSKAISASKATSASKAMRKVYLFDKNMDMRYMNITVPNLDGDRDNAIVLDGEFFPEKNTFWAFDCYFDGKKDVRNTSMQERQTALQAIIAAIKHDKIKMKTTTSLTDLMKGAQEVKPNDVKGALKDALNELKDLNNAFYQTDGFIFTPGGAVVEVEKKNSRVWAESFKWKEKNTIDLQVKKKTGPTEFILYGQNDEKISEYKYNDETRDALGLLSPWNLKFEGAAKAMNGDEIFDKSIVECYYAPEENKWIALKVRSDKKVPNQKTTIISNLNTTFDPVVLEDLLLDKSSAAAKTGMEQETDLNGNGYFATDETNDLPNLKKHHNQIKKNLLLAAASVCEASVVEASVVKSAEPTFNILEIAMGRGGNLHNWKKVQDLQRKNIYVFGLDKDTDAITEAEKRKQDAGYDFNSEFVVRDMVQAGFGTEKKFDLASIQFAIHYAFDSEVHVNQFLNNLEAAVKAGGVVCGTVFNGELIFKSKEEVKTLSNAEGNVIFQLEKLYKKADVIAKVNAANILSSVVGHEIMITQPSTQKQPTPEWLVFLQPLQKEMKKHNFRTLTPEEVDLIKGHLKLTREGQESLTKNGYANFSMLNMSADANLSENEKIISELNCLFLFKKNENGTAPAAAKAPAVATSASSKRPPVTLTNVKKNGDKKVKLTSIETL